MAVIKKTNIRALKMYVVSQAINARDTLVAEIIGLKTADSVL